MSLLPESVCDILFYRQAPEPAVPPPDLVSIIIASYNYAKVIVETLDSIVAQTFKNIELVIVDDCSPDNSVEVIRDWLSMHQDRFLRALLVRPHQNQGLAQSRNTAINLTHGKKIFVLDSDNILLPTSIHRHAEVMDRTGAAATYSAFEFFDGVKQVGVGDFWDIEKFKHYNFVDAMAMISIEAWKRVGGYSYFDVMGWEDYDLWLKFIEHDLTGVFIPEILCRYRVHKNSMSRIETNPKGVRLQTEITARHPWLTLDPIG